MTNEQENQENTLHKQPEARAGWAKWIVIGGVGLATVAGIGVATALSDDFGASRFEPAGWGGEGHFGRGGHRHGGFGGPGMGRVLAELDLSNEQEDRIWAIVDGLHSQARPLMRDFRDTREEVAKLLGAATIDRTALETLRAQRIAQIDEASKKLTTALLDAAAVLTPEQRAKFLEEMAKRGPRDR